MSKRRSPLYGTPRGPQPATISPQVARLLTTPRQRDRIEDDKGLPVPAPAEPPLDTALADLAAALPPEPEEPDVAREGLILFRSGNQYIVGAIPYVEGVTPVRVIDIVKSSSGLVATAAMTRRFQQNVAALRLLRASSPGETTVPFLPRAKDDRRVSVEPRDGEDRRVGGERRVAVEDDATTSVPAEETPARQ